jgi:hypothetical protein
MSFALRTLVNLHHHPWRHLIIFTSLTAVLALAALTVAAVGLQSSARPVMIPIDPSERVTPVTDPTNLRRLAFEDLRYEGAFRLPAAEVNGDSFSASGGPLAFNPAARTLFVGSRPGRVAEVTVPSPVNTADVAAMPFAEIVQPFFDPSEGQMKDVAEDANLAGLLVYGSRLYGTALSYYDANNTQSISHFSRSLALATKSAGKMQRVGDRGRSGYVAGYMATVPPEWQTALGGPAITGQCCVPIISRTSWGPAAFAWDPADLDHKNKIDVIPLVYYDSDHRTLGEFERSSPSFGGTTMVGGVAIIPGTRTAIFVGSNGVGELCYGNGTSDRSIVNTVGSDGAKFCYDPTNSDKGQHAFPYRYQMWAYDLNDWAAVRAGKRDPWEVKPYAIWPFELPISEPGTRIIGVAFDAAEHRLFISQRHADRDGYSYRALIHVFKTP